MQPTPIYVALFEQPPGGSPPIYPKRYAGVFSFSENMHVECCFIMERWRYRKICERVLQKQLKLLGYLLRIFVRYLELQTNQTGWIQHG